MQKIKRAAILMTAALLTTVFSTFLVSANENSSEQVRVYVEYMQSDEQSLDVNTAAESVASELDLSGAEIHYHFEELNSFVVSISQAALGEIERSSNVTSLEIDPIREILSSGDAVSSALTAASLAEEMPYGVERVQAPAVWSDGHNGAGRTVCVVDTGYYAAHEDLPNNVSGISQMSGESFNEDGNGHGSHVAGTIAALDNNVGVVGVAPGVDLFIIKFFNNDGNATYSSDLISAATSCYQNGANVINMSLGGGSPSNQEQSIFNQLYSLGVLSIAAAGNEGTSDSFYPASYPNVVSVAAIDSNNAKADFSQYNSGVELSAPGVNVLSAVPYIITNDVVVDGTLYAAGGMSNGPSGSATGALVDGGICDSVGNWSGRIVLCERGGLTFEEKAANAQSGGAVGVIIYNNAPGNFNGSLGSPTAVQGPTVSMSQEDGQFLVANHLGTSTTVTSDTEQPTSGYSGLNGTSMASPHVAAVAALIWSANPSWTNVEIREAMQQTAVDLGSTGRDVEFGFGLVQAKSALDYLMGNTGGGDSLTPTPMPTDPPVVPTATATPLPPTATPLPPEPSAEGVIYVSSSSGGSVGGVSFADEDILGFDIGSGTWVKLLDGSDVGLSGAGARDVDAFTMLDDGSILLSVVGATSLPDIGNVDDSDIVRFIPSALGETTIGRFEMYFDGSDVELTSNGEDVDSIHMLSDGDLVISTVGSATVTGLRVKDEDMMRFTPSSLGANTSGTWAIYFDGSDAGLSTSSNEDVWGISLADNGDIYLTTKSTFAVTGASGNGADVIRCTPQSLGGSTSCTFEMMWDGSAEGYGSELMDGLHIDMNGVIPQYMRLQIAELSSVDIEDSASDDESNNGDLDDDDVAVFADEVSPTAVSLNNNTTDLNDIPSLLLAMTLSIILMSWSWFVYKRS